MENYIVLRDSPDWSTFDLEETRAFLRRIHYPDSFVIDYARKWDATFAVSYLSFRHAVKQLSLANLSAVHDACFVRRDEFDAGSLGPDDLVLFIDDDDWLAPHLFERLRAWPMDGDGLFWASIRVGQSYTWPPANLPEPSFLCRPDTNVLFTNNYAPNGRTLQRLGVNSVFEHYDAQLQYEAGLFGPSFVPEYLSAANKHPCCTIATRFSLNSEPLLTGLRDMVESIRDDLALVEHDARSEWVRPYVDAMVTLLDQALTQGLVRVAAPEPEADAGRAARQAESSGAVGTDRVDVAAAGDVRSRRRSGSETA